MAFPRRAWLLPVVAAMLALLVTVPTIWSKPDTLYPVQVDSAEYDRVGRGLARLIHDLPSVVPKIVGGHFTDADRTRYEMNGWILQHAASYLTLLGGTYAASGGSEAAGRLLTALLFAGASALVVGWTRRRFGVVPALILLPLFVVWPAHVYFATAIMTEVPMLFFAGAVIVALDDGFGRRLPVGGAALALLLLTKTSWQAVAVPVLILDLWAHRPPSVGAAVRHLLGRAVGLGLVLGIWNGFLLAAGVPLNPLAERGDREMWLFRGNYVEDRGFETVGTGDVIHPELVQAIEEHPDAVGEERSKAVYRSAFLHTIAQEPVRWVALVTAKVRWYAVYPALKEDVRTWFGWLPPPAHWQPILIGLALLGFAASIRLGPRAWMPALLAVYLCGVHAFSHLVSRYNLPAIGLLLPYAAYGATCLVRAAAGVSRTSRMSNFAWTRRPLAIALLVALTSVALARIAGRDVLVRWGVGIETGHGLETLLGILAVAAWCLPGWIWLRDLGWSRRCRIAALGVLFGLPALTYWGERMIDPDPDRWRARLDHPGDRLVQEIDLPPGIDWDAVDAAEIQIDMLCSLNAHSAQPGSGVGPSARILLDGQVVASLPEEIPAAALDLDPRIFGVQDRFARVREAFSQHLEGFVNRRHPSAGFAYFPQWRRFAIDPHLLRGRTQARIEVVFEQGSGWIDVMGDGQVERLEAGSMGTRRLVRAPAFLTNAYDLSTHQFHTFASDRRRADVRLVRPLPLASPAARSLRAVRNGSPEPDLGRARGLPAGELRIRLRTRIDGTWVYRESARAATGDGILYATELQPGDEIVPETMLHNLAARRDTYFDGWITY